MADKKISALTAASTPLAGTEVLPIVQSGSTVKVSVADLTNGRAVAMAGGSFTDNITQSTAAKGVNFTANTPLAGMTSQLLNWYEEGTWTPVVSASNGTITSYTVNSARYTRIGRQVSVIMDIKITNAGTGTGLFIATLPLANGSQLTSGSGIEYYNNVVTLQGYVAASGTSVSIVKYDNSGIIATNNQVLFSLTYFV